MARMTMPSGITSLRRLVASSSGISVVSLKSVSYTHLQVKPGDTLVLSVEMIKSRGSIGVGKAVATVNGKKAVTARCV